MIYEDAINFIRDIPPFQFLDDDILKDLAGSLSLEFYPKDSVILRQDSPASNALRIIRKGGVKISLKSDGNEDIVIDYRGEGENFGLVSLFGGDKQKTTIVAVEDTECYLIDRDKVLALIDSQPVLTEYFLQTHFSKYMDKTYREMRNKSLLSGCSDQILFTTLIGEIANKEVITVDENATIQEAAQAMSHYKVSSVIVMGDNHLPAGIVTDSDLSEKVVAKGRDVHESVKNIMSLLLNRVDAKDYCFEAVLKMLKYNVNHLLVIKDGALRGILTNHDIMLLQGRSPLTFAKDMESQQTIEGLASVARKMNNLVGSLLKEGAKASNIMKIIAELNDRLFRRVIELAERKFGPAPITYCWVVFGSEGRREKIFKTYQYNALIYGDPGSAQQEEASSDYFSKIASFVRESLDRCCFPPCPSQYKASNPEWRQPLGVWKKYIINWISTPTADAVLKSMIFFDFRPLYGDFGIADELRSYLLAALEGQKVYLGYLANMAVNNRPPLGFFKSFVVEKSGEHKDELNIKTKGLVPLVDIVRLCALERGIKETSTLDRIEALRERHTIIREYADEIEQAFEFIALLRIHHQAALLEEGKAIDSFINPNRLSNLEKKSIKDAFHLIVRLQDSTIERYKALIW